MNQMKIPETAQEIQETLQDGAMLKVSLLNGTEEWVKVRKIPRKAFVLLADAILSTLTDEEAEAAYYLDRPVSYVQQLTEESFDAVMVEGRRLNFSRFGAWFKRRQDVLAIARVTGPDVDKVAEAVEKAMKGTAKA